MQRTALVTGADRGFGFALAEELLEQGLDGVVPGQGGRETESRRYQLRELIQDFARQRFLFLAAFTIRMIPCAAAPSNTESGQGSIRLFFGSRKALRFAPPPSRRRRLGALAFHQTQGRYPFEEPRLLPRPGVLVGVRTKGRRTRVHRAGPDSYEAP